MSSFEDTFVSFCDVVEKLCGTPSDELVSFGNFSRVAVKNLESLTHDFVATCLTSNITQSKFGFNFTVSSYRTLLIVDCCASAAVVQYRFNSMYKRVEYAVSPPDRAAVAEVDMFVDYMNSAHRFRWQLMMLARVHFITSVFNTNIDAKQHVLDCLNIFKKQVEYADRVVDDSFFILFNAMFNNKSVVVDEDENVYVKQLEFINAFDTAVVE